MMTNHESNGAVPKEFKRLSGKFVVCPYCKKQPGTLVKGPDGKLYHRKCLAELLEALKSNADADINPENVNVKQVDGIDKS